ncbi:MAG: hypothetical protein JW734_07990 [Candidatus Omnitrophica bacterium]|nr:hypothetical protein [Candidatus Omnitrophota bacterium]
MYKRCQVLLTDWQEEYIRDVAQRYDISSSEVVRLLVSGGALYLISLLHPEYKSSISGKDIANMLRKAANPDTRTEEKHKIIAKSYFEARKAVEYRLAKVKKAKKTNP